MQKYGWKKWKYKLKKKHNIGIKVHNYSLEVNTNVTHIQCRYVYTYKNLPTISMQTHKLTVLFKIYSHMVQCDVVSWTPVSCGKVNLNNFETCQHKICAISQFIDNHCKFRYFTRRKFQGLKILQILCDTSISLAIV